MFVYTFWEPRNRIPYYLRLCMETWKKFLPDATIIVLDYKNIGEFLDVRELGLNLFSGKLLPAANRRRNSSRAPGQARRHLA